MPRLAPDGGFVGTPELTNGWYRAYRFALSPRQVVQHVHKAPVVIVQTGEGAATASGARVFGLNGASSWSYFDANEAHELRSRFHRPVELVEIEVRQPR